MSVTASLSERLRPLLDLVFPLPCLSCERRIESGRDHLGLCVRCRGRLRPLRGPLCETCARSFPGRAIPAGYRCGACRRRPPPYDRLLALWSYRPPLDAVIHGLKFGRLEYLGRHLALRLAAALRDVAGETDLVVPVPLHWGRWLGRGYNQAERIATPLARRLGLPAARALRRVRPTPAQARLAAERRAANLRGAFRARGRVRLAGRRLLLVDDVVTTGATLRAAAACLRRAGPERIVAVVAARTPGPEEIRPDPAPRSNLQVFESKALDWRAPIRGQKPLDRC